MDQNPAVFIEDEANHKQIHDERLTGEAADGFLIVEFKEDQPQRADGGGHDEGTDELEEDVGAVFQEVFDFGEEDDPVFNRQNFHNA